jgi:DNA repair protein RecO (recombination protein O)
LSDDLRDPRLVIDAFLLQSLATGGWAPSFSDCAQCGADGPHRWIHLASGGAVCEHCRPSGAVSISPGTSALLGALLSGDWSSTAAASTTSRRAASGVVAAYLQMHLERDLRSLPIADRAWLSELSIRLSSEQDVVA